MIIKFTNNFKEISEEQSAEEIIKLELIKLSIPSPEDKMAFGKADEVCAYRTERIINALNKSKLVIVPQSEIDAVAKTLKDAADRLHGKGTNP